MELSIEHLKNGIDQNILVFDDNNNKGIITHRLLGLMCDVAVHNYGERPTEFYSTHGIEIEYPHIYSTVYGFEIKPATFDIEEEYKKMGGTFPYRGCTSDRIIIALGPNSVLLGCF